MLHTEVLNMIATAYNLYYVMRHAKKGLQTLCGQCCPRSACVPMQSDLRATMSSDKSMRPFLQISRQCSSQIRLCDAQADLEIPFY